MSLEELDEDTLKAIKKLITGFCLKEVTKEYALDANGKRILTKEKISKKVVPPNTDIVKMMYQKNDKPNSFDGWTDEQLEQEKQRLLKMLKEGEEDECRANKN